MCGLDHSQPPIDPNLYGCNSDQIQRSTFPVFHWYRAARNRISIELLALGRIAPRVTQSAHLPAGTVSPNLATRGHFSGQTHAQQHHVWWGNSLGHHDLSRSGEPHPFLAGFSTLAEATTIYHGGRGFGLCVRRTVDDPRLCRQLTCCLHVGSHRRGRSHHRHRCATGWPRPARDRLERVFSRQQWTSALGPHARSHFLHDSYLGVVDRTS